MRILGIDPGTRVAGYGVVDGKGNKVIGVAAGVWRLGEDAPIASRLAQLAIEFRRVLETFSPTHLCLELAFIAKNPRSALFLGQARGVILSEAHQAGLIITEVSATSAKKLLTSYGRADKETVARTVSRMLQIDVAKLPFDATDALCIAYAFVMKNYELEIQKRAALGSKNNEDVLKLWAKAAKDKKRGVKGFKSFLE